MTIFPTKNIVLADGYELQPPLHFKPPPPSPHFGYHLPSFLKMLELLSLITFKENKLSGLKFDSRFLFGSHGSNLKRTRRLSQFHIYLVNESPVSPQISSIKQI